MFLPEMGLYNYHDSCNFLACQCKDCYYIYTPAVLYVFAHVYNKESDTSAGIYVLEMCF